MAWLHALTDQAGKGSLIAEFWGDIKQLLFTGQMLDMEKLEIGVSKDEVNFKKAEIDLAALEEEKAQQLKEGKRI